MTFECNYGSRLDLRAEDDNHNRPCVAFTITKLEGPNVSWSLDENHATALALALQAAVAEIQARAVPR